MVGSALGEGFGVPPFQASDDPLVHLVGGERLFALGFTPLGAVSAHRAVLLQEATKVGGNAPLANVLAITIRAKVERQAQGQTL
jgi:hypothetical protein